MNTELQAVVEFMERERGIDRDTMIEALESALVSAAKKSVGGHEDLRVAIDRKTFKVQAFAKVKVVAGFASGAGQISLLDAKSTVPGAQIGDVIEKEVPPQEFGRIAAQTAKQAILQRIRKAEKEKIFDEHKGRAGDIATGTVRRFERNDVIIDLGVGEGIMPSRERVSTEEYNVNDRIRAYVVSVTNPAAGPQILLSRSHPNFVRRLFELEVAEIAEGTVEIKGIAREAGFRSKVAVNCPDPKVDPVGACVGMRGIRVKNIVRELGGEKIDIVRWSPDIETYVHNALAPAKLARVEVDQATQTVKVIVAQDQLSLAIGKKGQNARLTAKLTGWKIDITRDGPELDFEEQVAKAIDGLAAIPSISESQAISLVHAGFLTLEGLMAADIEDIASAQDIDAATATNIKRAAEAYYEKHYGNAEDEA
jgi:N utilization substance protein A